MIVMPWPRIVRSVPKSADVPIVAAGPRTETLKPSGTVGAGSELIEIGFCAIFPCAKGGGPPTILPSPCDTHVVQKSLNTPGGQHGENAASSDDASGAGLCRSLDRDGRAQWHSRRVRRKPWDVRAKSPIMAGTGTPWRRRHRGPIILLRSSLLLWAHSLFLAGRHERRRLEGSPLSFAICCPNLTMGA